MNTHEKKSLNESADDFEAPVIIKKSKKLNKTIVSTTSRKPRRPSKKKQMTLHEVINQNFSHTDVNSDHLQLALALSKSISEEQNTEQEIDLGIFEQQKSVAKGTLLEYGFQSNRRKLNVENIACRREPPKNKKSKFRFLTPILMMRTEEERQSLIESKLSLIIHQNILDGSSGNQNYSCFSPVNEKLREMLCEECCLFRRDNKIHEPSAFKVPNLNFIASTSRCGCLLKDWKNIALRDHTPERFSTKIIADDKSSNNTSEVSTSFQKEIHEGIQNYEVLKDMKHKDSHLLMNHETLELSSDDTKNNCKVCDFQETCMKNSLDEGESISNYIDNNNRHIPLSPDLFDEEIESTYNSFNLSSKARKSLKPIFTQDTSNSIQFIKESNPDSYVTQHVSDNDIYHFDVYSKNDQEYCLIHENIFEDSSSKEVVCSPSENTSNELTEKLDGSNEAKVILKQLHCFNTSALNVETIILNSSEEDDDYNSKINRESDTRSNNASRLDYLKDDSSLSSYNDSIEKRSLYASKEKESSDERLSQNEDNMCNNEKLPEVQFKSVYFSIKKRISEENNHPINIKLKTNSSSEPKTESVNQEPLSVSHSSIINGNSYDLNDSNISQENNHPRNIIMKTNSSNELEMECLNQRSSSISHSSIINGNLHNLNDSKIFEENYDSRKITLKTNSSSELKDESLNHRSSSISHLSVIYGNLDNLNDSNISDENIRTRNIILETNSSSELKDGNLNQNHLYILKGNFNDSNIFDSKSKENISLNLTEHIENILKDSYGQVNTLTLSEEEFERSYGNEDLGRTISNIDVSEKIRDNSFKELMRDNESDSEKCYRAKDTTIEKDNAHSTSDVIYISDEELNYSSTVQHHLENEAFDISEIHKNVMNYGTDNYKQTETFSNLKLRKSVSFCDSPNRKINNFERNKSESDITPSRNVTIKTENVTPMMNYETLSTPDIVRELDKFGLKPLKRKRGVNLLKHIYETTHPLVASKKTNEFEKNNRAVKKFKKNEEAKNQDHILDFEHPSGIVRDEMADNLIGSITESSAIFERQRSTKIPTCQIPLQLVWHNFLLQNPHIWDSILLYDPLQVEVIHKKLKEMGFKFHLQDLITFLDQKCITIRVAQNHNINKS